MLVGKQKALFGAVYPLKPTHPRENWKVTGSVPFCFIPVAELTVKEILFL